MGVPRCPECGHSLANDANFCRSCGAPRTVAAAPASATERRPAGDQAAARTRAASSGGRGPIVAALAILALGAGGAVAILLAAGGGSSSTTVVRSAAGAQRNRAGGPVRAGRYLQAGTFQTASHAEMERRRLAAHGIEIEVVPSDTAKELYPGFQVLLGGPVNSRAKESTMLTSLHRDGVPSAFARDLSPAPHVVEGDALAGRWTGELERTSSEHPNLDGPVPATLAVTSDGASGSLQLPTLRCRARLSLVAAGGPTFRYAMTPACGGTGPLVVRPDGSEAMLTLLSPDTDSFAVGTLSRD